MAKTVKKNRTKKSATKCYVYLDTNAFWHGSWDHFFSPALGKVLDKFSNKIIVDLRVPQVCIDEREFQVKNLLMQQYNAKVAKHKEFTATLGLGQKGYPVKESDLTSYIENKKTEFAKKHNVTFIKTNFNDFNIEDIYKESVNRTGLFRESVNSKPVRELEKLNTGAEFEKGFRDYLITRTISKNVSNKKKTDVLVVSQDKFFREEIEKLKSGVVICHSLEDLENHLMIQTLAKSSALIEKHLPKITSGFYKKGSNSSFYVKKLSKEMKKQFQEYISEYASTNFLYISPSYIYAKKIGEPVLKDKIGDTYHFETKVEMHGDYDDQMSTDSLSHKGLLSIPDYKVDLNFVITWKCDLNKSGNVTNFVLKKMTIQEDTLDITKNESIPLFGSANSFFSRKL